MPLRKTVRTLLNSISSPCPLSPTRATAWKRYSEKTALAAWSFLGLVSVWAQGLSGSAALQLASPGALQPQIRDIVAHGGAVPGGIITFGAGLSLILKYTGWAKRLYVRFKRRHPKKGSWADWSLRRASARRREEVRRRREAEN